MVVKQWILHLTLTWMLSLCKKNVFQTEKFSLVKNLIFHTKGNIYLHTTILTDTYKFVFIANITAGLFSSEMITYKNE